MVVKTYIHTICGALEICGDEQGISSIAFGRFENKNPYIPPVLAHCVEELTAYLDGSLQPFSFKMNPKGTDFQKRVWAVLTTIPHGQTLSYLELAEQLGNPLVIRAAAAANGKNPIAIAIPCHRVIGSDGSLTGYAGGLEKKAWLLAHEGSITQLKLF